VPRRLPASELANALLGRGSAPRIADFVRGPTKEVKMSARPHTLWLTVAIGLIAAPAAASGQETLALDVDASTVVIPHTATMVAEAVTLERPGHYLEAAELYEAAASILGNGDPDVLKYLTRAGLLCYYAGELERARQLFEEVGIRASDLGDIPVARVAYERALNIAIEQGDMPRAATLYLKSLPDEERDELLERRRRRQ